MARVRRRAFVVQPESCLPVGTLVTAISRLSAYPSFTIGFVPTISSPYLRDRSRSLSSLNVTPVKVGRFRSAGIMSKFKWVRHRAIISDFFTVTMTTYIFVYNIFLIKKIKLPPSFIVRR